MSISNEINLLMGEDRHFVRSVIVYKDIKHHGEDATQVTVGLSNGKEVTGIFTTRPQTGFGGVEFAKSKNIPILMVHKIRSVLAGTAE